MIFQLVVGLALIGASHEAKSSGEIRALFLEQAMECNKERLVSADEIMLMKNDKLPSSNNVKCLLACVMRKMNFLNDKGDYDYENANKWAESFHDDPKNLEKGKKILDACVNVNDEPVKDGAKGCDRAYQLTKCLMINTPKMGL